MLNDQQLLRRNATKNRQDAHAKFARLDRHQSAALEQRSMFSYRCDYEVADHFRYRILRSDLNHTRTKRLRNGEDVAEIEVVREDHVTVVTREGHDFPIPRSRIPEIGPVQGVDAGREKILGPRRAEIHVDGELHDEEIGTSNSSARHAA